MRQPRPSIARFGLIAIVAAIAGGPTRARAQSGAFDRSSDRGAGIPASMFGTYIERHQLLLFPFGAYTRDHDREYNPARLGFGLDEDFRGRFSSTEALVFAAYGVTDWLALEFEASRIRATFDKSNRDTSALPARIVESGLADFEGQLRLRLWRETEGRPEVFGFVEITAPSQTHTLFIGDDQWDVRPGLGVVRGFSWGTMTFRTDLEWNRDDRHLDLGESSIEYLRRLSPAWRLNLAIEGGETGAPDEWELVTGVQWRLRDFLLVKADNVVGLFSKATDWSPQIGLMLALPH
jgi:hypothetical protein